jgi:Alpha-2-macroglobulin bait region domain
LESRVIELTESESSEQASGSLSVEFEIEPTARYLPQTYVVAYYIKNGDIIVANAYINLRNNLPNFVEFSFDTMEVKPGAEIEFKVNSYYHSLVSLSAIDQRLK